MQITLCFLISVDLPEITQGPESQSVATRADATFRVEATGDDLQFQWQKDGINIDSKEHRLHCNSTGNTSTLCIQHTEKSDKGHYRCLVKSPIEKSGKLSNEADLSVCKCVILLHEKWVPNILLSFHSVDPPNIAKNPKSQSVATGADATFRVEVTGDDLKFQWQKDGIDIDSSEPRLQCNSVRNVSTLHIKDTNKSDKGHYRCLIRNPVEKRGLPSTEANLLVCKSVSMVLVLSQFHITAFFHLSVDPPEITQGPESQSVASGTDATFTVEATGDEIEFQWQKNERNIVGNESRFKVSRCADTSTLCIQNTEKNDKGHYRCLIKNPVEKKEKPSKKAGLSVCKLVL